MDGLQRKGNHGKTTIYLPNVRVEERTVAEDIKVLLSKIKPSWPTEEIVLTPLTGGFSCLMFRCYPHDQREEESLTVRAASKVLKNYTSLVDGEFEKKVILTLSKADYFSPVTAIFGNGYCYEYIQGEPLTTPLTTCVDFTDEIYRLIARQMAEIHSVKLENEDFGHPSCFERLRCSVRKEYPVGSNGIPSRKDMIKEIDLVENHLTKLGCPIVLSHGDPHPGNMVYNKEAGVVTFVDWEFSQINYQPFDIAFFLNSLEDMVPSVMGIKVVYDNEVHRSKFLRYYLEYWFRKIGRPTKEVTEDEINELSNQTMKFKMFVQLRLAVCGFCYSNVFDIAEDFASVGKRTLQHYLNTKTKTMEL